MRTLQKTRHVLTLKQSLMAMNATISAMDLMVNLVMMGMKVTMVMAAMAIMMVIMVMAVVLRLNWRTLTQYKEPVLVVFRAGLAITVFWLLEIDSYFFCFAVCISIVCVDYHQLIIIISSCLFTCLVNPAL